MKVIKYLGDYGEVRVEGTYFKAGVPTVVPKDSLATTLLAMNGFVESSLAELEAHLNPESASPAPAKAAPKEKK